MYIKTCDMFFYGVVVNLELHGCRMPVKVATLLKRGPCPVVSFTSGKYFFFPKTQKK